MATRPITTTPLLETSFTSRLPLTTPVFLWTEMFGAAWIGTLSSYIQAFPIASGKTCDSQPTSTFPDGAPPFNLLENGGRKHAPQPVVRISSIFFHNWVNCFEQTP